MNGLDLVVTLHVPADDHGSPSANVPPRFGGGHFDDHRLDASPDQLKAPVGDLVRRSGEFVF